MQGPTMVREKTPPTISVRATTSYTVCDSGTDARSSTCQRKQILLAYQRMYLLTPGGCDCKDGSQGGCMGTSRTSRKM